MWLLVVFFLLDPGQMRYRASVCLSSCFFYILTHRNLYPQMKFLATPLVTGACCEYYQDRVKMRLDLSTRRPSAPTEALQEGGAGHDETLVRTGK